MPTTDGPTYIAIRLPLAVLAGLVLVGGLLVAEPGARADADSNTAHDEGAVTAWARHHAHPLATIDPAAPPADLLFLRNAIGDATIVGLGESAHGAADEIKLKDRVLRFLVEDVGFRSIAWEEDWTTGVEIDEYIQGGAGDADALVARMSPQYQFAEVADVLRWLRAFNTGRPDPVHFVGVEYYFTRQLAYDTVEGHVAAVAPERLDELRADLEPIEPTSPDPFTHIADYAAVDDKEPYIEHAHRVRDLVTSLAHDPGDRAYETAVHAAGQIVSFYEHYAMPDADSLVYREARSADSVQWWQGLTGDRVVYWAATPHTANAPDLRIVQPSGEMRFPSTGSYLRQWYGGHYLSIGFVLDHGTIATGEGDTAALPPAAAEWFEHPLGAVGRDPFVLDLRVAAPRPVDAWLHDPATTRGPEPGSSVVGGTVAQWFDLLVHRQIVTPANPPATGETGVDPATSARPQQSHLSRG